MQVAFRQMTRSDAAEIAAWRYAAPYDFYDADADAGDLAMLLQAGPGYFTALSNDGECVGFIQVTMGADTADVGLGLRPDLTGRGFGVGFLNAVLAFVGDTFHPARFSLAVAEFNERAIRVYRRVGFVETERFIQQTNGGQWPFVRMARHTVVVS